MPLPLAALVPFAMSLAASYALGEGLHRGTKTKRLGEVERDIFNKDPEAFEADRKEAERYFNTSLAERGRDTAQAVLAYRAGVKHKTDYDKAKANTWGDSPDALLRVDKQDLLADIATGPLGWGKLGIKQGAGLGARAAAVGGRAIMEAMASIGGQAGGNAFGKTAENMGLGALGTTAASLVGGLAGGMGGSLGGHAATSAYRAGKFSKGIGQAVGNAVEAATDAADTVTAHGLPLPTPGKIGRQTPIVYGQVGKQTPSQGFADLLARAQAGDADALMNPVVPSKRGTASAADVLSLMDDAPAGNTVIPAVAQATAEESRRAAFIKLRDLMQADIDSGSKSFNSADLRARVQKELNLPDDDPVLGQINSKSVSRTAEIIRKNMEGKAKIIPSTAEAAREMNAPAATAPAPKGERPVTYAGIGSRKTPEPILKLMTQVSEALSGQRGWNLRSGGAEGADTAFEAGVKDVSKKRIYLPTKKLKGRADGVDGAVFIDNPEAGAIAERHHPTWGKLSDFAKKLMARNSHQVLGDNLDDPSDFVLAWAPIKNGKPTGGTSQAIRIAQEKGIPVINLATRKSWTLKEVLDEIDRVRGGGRPSKPKETGAFSVGQAPKSDRIPGTIDPATNPKSHEDFEDEWRMGDPRGAAGTNVAVSDARADSQPPYNNIRTDHKATDPFDARLYTEDTPVQEGNRLANEMGEKARAAKGLKEYSESEKGMRTAMNTLRGKATPTDIALHKEWMEKLAPTKVEGADVPKSTMRGVTPDYTHKKLNGLVSAKTYAAVRQLGENIDVDKVDLDYIATIQAKIKAARDKGVPLSVADLENDLKHWMASLMDGMHPTEIDSIAANYSLQRSVFNKIHLLMPNGSRSLLTNMEQKQLLIKAIGPKAAAMARSRATQRLAKEAAEEEQAYARRIGEEIRKGKAKAAAEAGITEPAKTDELYTPDTTPIQGKMDMQMEPPKPVVDSAVEVKPPFTPQEKMKVNKILDEILPLARLKDPALRKSVTEAADALRQRKMTEIPDDIRKLADRVNETLDAGFPKKVEADVEPPVSAGKPNTWGALDPADALEADLGLTGRDDFGAYRNATFDTPVGNRGSSLGASYMGIPFPEIDPDSTAGKAVHAFKSLMAEPLSNLPLPLQRAFRSWQDTIAVTKSDTFAIAKEMREFRNKAGIDNAKLKELWEKGGDKTVDALRERYARIIMPTLQEAEAKGLLKKGSADPFHMPRLYKLFEMKAGDYVPEESLWGPAAARLVADGHAKDVNEAMDALGDLVNHRKGWFDGAHKVAARLKRAMSKHEIPDELQAFMGKVDDPVYGLWKNASDWVKDVETLKLAGNLVERGEGTWVSHAPKEGWVKWDDRWLQAWESATGLPIAKNGKLSNLWVHPDVAEPLIVAHREASDLAKCWKIGMSLFKMAKVPLSMATQAVNVIGNSWLTSLGGMNLMKQGEALPGALREIVNSARGIDSEWVAAAKKAGVIGKHFMAEDLDLLADGLIQTMKMKKGSGPLKAMIGLRELVDRSPLAKPGEWYGMLEDSYRLMLFRHCMEEGISTPMLSRASAFMSTAKMSAVEAAEHVNKTLFDYTRVPKSIDAMRNTLWPFITFPYKYASSVVRLGKENPVRLFTHIAGAAFLVNELKKNGYDVNVSRFIPGMGMLFPEEYDRDKHPLARGLDVLKPGGPGVWPYEVAAGKSVFTGGEIYHEDDTIGEKVVKGIKHVGFQALPPLLGYTGRKLLQAWDDTFNGNEPENRAKRDFTRELVEATTGIRVTPRTQEEWTNKQKTVYGRMRSEQARFSAYLRAHPNIPEGEIEKRQAQLEKNLLKLWDRWDELEQEKLSLPSR